MVLEEQMLFWPEPKVFHYDREAKICMRDIVSCAAKLLPMTVSSFCHSLV